MKLKITKKLETWRRWEYNLATRLARIQRKIALEERRLKGRPGPKRVVVALAAVEPTDRGYNDLLD